MQQSSTYALGSSQPEIERLSKQAVALQDEATWLFDQVQIQPGWRVLDLGCGTRGVLDMLARRVGPTGKVVGIDASPTMVEQARSFVAASGHDNIEVHQGDAADTKLPRSSFDMVHARLLLVNLPSSLRPRILSEMLALLKPGGVLVLQDIDAAAMGCDPYHPAWDALLNPFKRVVDDGLMGRQLPRLVHDVGAVEVRAHFHAIHCPPGHIWRYLPVQLTESTRGRILQLGYATAEELDAAKSALMPHLDDHRTTVLGPLMAQVWARRSTSQ